MKTRAVPRIYLLSSLLFAGSWSLFAEAVPKAPVTAYCQNALGRNVTCPPPPKPAVGATARRAYLRSFGRDLRDKQVVRLEGGTFQILTPAEWYSDDEDAVQGWCVAQVDEQPVQRTRFYHVWLDEKSCLATRNEVIRPEPFDPKGSIRLGEEGTVNVSFRVDKRGTPIDVEFVSGSDAKPLQEGALRYVKLLRVRATCPDVRYLTQVHFRLDDSGEPRE